MEIKEITDKELQHPTRKILKNILYNTNFIDPKYNDLLFEYFTRGLTCSNTLTYREHNLNHSFLFYATIKDNYKAAKYMLENGATPNFYCGLNRSTALHYACLHHNERIVELLLKHGAKTNLTDGGGSTPMIMLVMGIMNDIGNNIRMNIKYRLITLLIENGANPYAGRFGSYNSIEVAEKYYGSDMYNFILDEYNWYRRRKLIMFRKVFRDNHPKFKDLRASNEVIETPEWAKNIGIDC